MKSMPMKAIAFALVLVELLTLSARAQTGCWPHWDPVAGTGGPNNAVTCAVRWRPPTDGAHELLIVGGHFTDAGGKEAYSVAAWDPVTQEWQSLNLPGWYESIDCMTVAGSGELVIGGTTRYYYGPIPFPTLRWNGTRWNTFATDDLGSYTIMATLRNGNVVAAATPYDDFRLVSRRIAEWTGRAWRRFGGDADDQVRTLTPAPDGSLFRRRLSSHRIGRVRLCCQVEWPRVAKPRGWAGWARKRGDDSRGWIAGGRRRLSARWHASGRRCGTLERHLDSPGA
jgi:hypothetical protein